MADAVAEFQKQIGVVNSLNSLNSHFGREWPILDEAALHGVAGDIVRTLDPHTEADPVAILIQLLVFFGNVIGRNAHFKAESDRHALVEYAVLVGDTSKARKGTSQGHVRRLFDSIDQNWSESCIAAGLSSGEGLVNAVKDPDPEDEHQSSQPREKRLLICEGEFASVLRVMVRDGNTLSATMRNLWDTGNHRNLVKKNPLKTTGAHVSMIGHITSDELIRYIDRTECANGFANRIRFHCVRRSKLLPEGGQVDDADMDPLRRRLREAVFSARSAGEIKRDELAKMLWHKEYGRISQGRLGLTGAMLSRAEAHVMRLASLYALLDQTRLISLEHLTAALALWDHCDQSVRFIFKDSFGDPDADLILRALQERGAGLSRTEISALFHGHKPSEQIEAALSLLAKSGVAERREVKTGGRPEERWYLLPTAK